MRSGIFSYSSKFSRFWFLSVPSVALARDNCVVFYVCATSGQFLFQMDLICILN